MGGQRDDAGRMRNLVQMQHQRLANALASKLRCDKEMINISGLLQVRETCQVALHFGHPRLV